jgi:class 3 adenylate cyclase/ketosteroid isomerase-like protein
MTVDPKVEAEVRAYLNEFQYDSNRSDIEALRSQLAPDLVGFGTGSHERYVGADEFLAGVEQDIGEVEAIEREHKWLAIVERGPIIIFTLEYDISWTIAGQRHSSPARLSGVLERHEGRLRAVHSHMSFPASHQSTGQSWPTAIEYIASAVSIERPDLRQQAAPDGTVTMLFTDIENSTVLTERLGDTHWLELLQDHNEIVRTQVRRHGCFEVKSQGDGFMVASQSARRALQCAIGIQRGLAEHNTDAAEPISVRMGLHTGEVLKDADDFFGKHVILASRIAGKARGGEILVSSLLRELTETGGDIDFGESREVELKGLSGTHRVHEVVWAA